MYVMLGINTLDLLEKWRKCSWLYAQHYGLLQIGQKKSCCFWDRVQLGWIDEMGIWDKLLQLMDKVTFFNPAFSDLDKNWHCESPWPKYRHYLILKPARWRTKQLQGCQLGITYHVPTHSVFSVKISDWVRWKGVYE
jgi:hypothetical protein